MEKLTIDELKRIKEQDEHLLNPDPVKKEYRILVCNGTGCTSSKSPMILKKFEEGIAKRNLQNVQVVKTGCFGLCALGPIVIVYPEGSFYSEFKIENVERVLDEHIVGGQVCKDLLYSETIEGDNIKPFADTTFYGKQKRVVLRDCGVINPEKISEYILRDGYTALARALTNMKPEEVIEVIKNSGLRGRGGAGFPTFKKWEMVRAAQGDVKYVACNADEGDPGAFMDRSVLEGNPHCIIEAMALAGYAVGAHKGFVYIRAEYPIAVNRLRIAIEQAKEHGLLGENILGTGFDFDLEIRLGAGAFVCGEETALMNSIAGLRGEPNVKPPFPANKGIFGCPTSLNNVETYANIPQIILNGADWFKSMGTEKSPGTKVFAVTGKINHVGLVEVPMGTTLREIIYDICGGIPNGKKFKAAQTGGPSGGCIPEEYLDLPIDFDTLASIGCMMGSGGLIVMDETTCMVDMAKFFLEFTVDESCGKCTPCRIGNKRMLELLDKFTKGQAKEEDITKLEELAHFIGDASLCGLGKCAPNPVLSTLKSFRNEYENHIKGICDAKVCKALKKYQINPDICKGCSACSRACPVGCISGEIKSPFKIDSTKCIKCGTCAGTCKFGAIEIV
ncbi:MAG: NADH-quinone oxidoreductase subunit NuoF [Clostridia bacterium]|nr:NADH-quinone oxidoreductase subunit NuoF [Clostridia bacterium]